MKYYTDENNVVNRFAFVLKPAVDEFLSNLSPVIYIDGTFSKDSAHLFCFSFLDANHHLQPMGCVYGTSENAAAMMILFDELWNAGLRKAKQIIFVSDNGSGINLFIKNL